jgi:hypothetical protein
MTHTVLFSDILTGIPNVNIFGHVEGTTKEGTECRWRKFDDESDRTLTESNRIMMQSMIE